MGYSTDFTGEFKLSRPATAIELAYINTFSRTRRMKRNPAILMDLYKGKHGYPFVHVPTPAQAKQIKALEKVGFSVISNNGTNRTAEEIYGKEGEFFCKDDGEMGQAKDLSVVDYNKEASTQHGLWNHWVLSEDGTELVHDGGEKTYNYIQWLGYMIKNFFAPWGIILNGEVEWKGEDSTDMGKIIVDNNLITVKKAVITYE